MLAKTILATLAFAATTLAGQALVENKCDSTVYVTSVDSIAGPTIPLVTGGIWSEPFHYNGQVGPTVKVSTNAASAGPVLQLAYTPYPEGWVYYSLNTVFGYDPLFQGKNVTVEGTAEGVIPIIWDGAPLESSNTFAYNGETDLVLTLCA